MPYEYGSVMASNWVDGWEDVLSAIERKDVYTKKGENFGLETNPHVTILHGLKDQVHGDLVCRICQSLENPLEVEIQNASTFEQDEYDVLKFDVDSDLLHKMNKAFRGLPHESRYDEYKPHMTVAYLKKGKADKYIGNLADKLPNSARFRKMQFTPAGAEGPEMNISI